MSVVQEEDRPALFDVVFQSIDFFRGEVDKVEAGEPLDKNIDSFMANINTLIAKIKGEEAPEPAPAPAAPAAQAAAVRSSSQPVKRIPLGTTARPSPVRASSAMQI